LPTPSTATQQRPQLAGIDAAASRLAAHQTGSEAWERDQMLDRLQNLRRVLPALAQEMAAARRQAARLRTDNRRLSEQVRQLRKTLAAHEHKPA
jgi:predicted  nucleic acid-binding Zn-ribbon protein